MNAHLVLLIAALLIGIAISASGNTPKNRKTYIIIILGLLTAESCLRGLSVGSDTLNYWYYYEEAKAMSWGNVWQQFVARYTQNSDTFDIGYILLEKAVQIFSGDFSVFLFVCALSFFIPFGVLLYRHTTDMTQLIFIFVLYVALFNMIAMSGVRKEIALGFAIWAFLCFSDGKNTQAIIVTLIGITIHMTTLLIVLIPLLNLLNQRQLRVAHIVAFLLIPIMIGSSGEILTLMGNVVDNEKYAAYGQAEREGGAVVFVVLMELISLFCYIAFRNINLDEDKFLKKLYTNLPCFTAFAPLIMHIGSMIRISQYFHVYIVLLLPYAIDHFFGEQNRKAVYFVLTIVLIALCLKSADSSYLFIWQDNMK